MLKWISKAIWLGLWWGAVPLVAAPSFSEVKQRYQISEATLLDAEGVVLQKTRVNLASRQFEWVPLADISPSLKSAVLFLEDRRFTAHGGVDYRALLRAAWDQRPWYRGAKRGASTVTMQLTGLLNPSLDGKRGRRSGWQKLTQIRDAKDLEKTWTKDQVFEAYLNLVSFHGDKRGLRAASRLLLGKDPHGLTEAEAMVLASRIQSPARQRTSREARVCSLYRQWKKVKECEPVKATLTSSWGRSSAPPASPGLAYHLLMKLKPREARPVRTTLDRSLQERALDSLRDHVTALNGKNVKDGAVLVIENETGFVRAYVGNVGDGSSAKYVDAIVAPRQAGSTLKPFVYAAAFEKGIIKPETLLEDTPAEIAVDGGRGVYRPQNYDNKFRGWVSARNALASSLNVPALKVFLMVGGETVVHRMQKLGFTNLREAQDYGPSLALGTADISLWELTNAYRALANGGLSSDATVLAEASGPAREPVRVFTAEAVATVSSILSDRSARAMTFGLESSLSTRSWTAVKTGTSKDMRDNWCVGYGKKFTVGVWVGNLSGEPMWNVSGISGAAPVWAALMNELEAGGKAKSKIPEAPPAEDAVPLPQRRVARILYPTEGMIVALDPDIPHDHQRIFFETEAKASGDRLVLHGEPEPRDVLDEGWTPRSGVYEVVLQGKDGKPKDRVAFEVRGRVHGL